MDSVTIFWILCSICAVVRPTVGQTESTSTTQANETDSVTNVTTVMSSTIPTTVTTEMNETTTMYSTVVTTQELFNCNNTGCLNGGTCQSNGTCLCSDYYDGDQCEVMTDCPPGSCSLTGATHCTVNMSKPVCHCKANYIGVICNHENICLKGPCKNNGTCEMKEQGAYTCSCVTGDPQRDCALNDFDACEQNPPASRNNYISCIDLIGGKKMLCAPSNKGVGCIDSRDPDEYCFNNSCSDNAGFCKPLCNRPECNGTAACNFTVFNSDDYLNVTKDCTKLFADGYTDHTCYNEADLFDGFDVIRSSLKDCSPFFDTICTRNVSDGICNPHCNTSECLWDGLDCVNWTLETFDGSILIELKNPVSARQYSALGLALRSGVYYHEFYNLSPNPQLQLKVVKPSELQSDDNSTNNIGQFTSIQHSGLFLASFTAKLPLSLTGISDIFVCEAGRHGDKCAENCSEYCTKEGDICDFVTGVCLHGCRTGWFGEMCLESCPRGCSGQCHRDTGNCKTCVEGRYGVENCSMDCDSYCRGIGCDVITGQCDCGWGRYFSLDKSECSECSVGCEGNCSATGSCTCKPEYFGTICDKTCSAECKTNTCHTASGRCMGCKAGFYGDICEKKCGLGCTECQQDSGACGGKCKEGYVGADCQKATAEAVTDNTGVIVAVIVAVLIILVIIIIAVCYWRYRQAGDYVLKDEEDVDPAPVPKVTSQEVKAHYGLQPLQASPLDGHSSEMIDMDSKPLGGVYAGPAVTVAYTKENDSVAFDEKNKTSAKEDSEEQGLDPSEQDITEDTHLVNSVNISVTLGADVNNADMADGVDVVDADQNASSESREGGAIRAPLASEEDLTASQVLNTEVKPPPNSSIDSLENEALDALDHVGDEANSKRSSKSSEQSKHSRSSSSSSSSSKSSKHSNKEDEPQKTEM